MTEQDTAEFRLGIDRQSKNKGFRIFVPGRLCTAHENPLIWAVQCGSDTEACTEEKYIGKIEQDNHGKWTAVYPDGEVAGRNFATKPIACRFLRDSQRASHPDAPSTGAAGALGAASPA